MSRTLFEPFAASARARGSALIYATLLLPLVFLVLGLGVDQAIVVMGRQQLQAAADAGALAGAAELGGAAAETRVRMSAKEAGEMNRVMGQKVQITTSDVELGTWNHENREFTRLHSDQTHHANAVRVSTVASSHRGSGLKTLMGSLMGRPTTDVETQAVAYRLSVTPPKGFTGLDSFDSRGVLTTAAVDPNGHPRLLEMLRRPDKGGDIVSNGNVRLHLLGLAGITWIHGDVISGGRLQLPIISLTRITGDVKSLPRKIHCPPVPNGLAMRNDNHRLSGLYYDGQDFTALGVVDLPSGTYRVRNFTVLAGAIVNVRGPVTIIATNKVTVLGSVLNLNRKPRDLRILVAGNDPVDLAATADMYCDLYAPTSDLRITAGLRYTGRFVAKNVDILATSFLFADPTLGDPFEGLNPMALVK